MIYVNLIQVASNGEGKKPIVVIRERTKKVHHNERRHLLFNIVVFELDYRFLSPEILFHLPFFTSFKYKNTVTIRTPCIRSMS